MTDEELRERIETTLVTQLGGYRDHYIQHATSALIALFRESQQTATRDAMRVAGEREAFAAGWRAGKANRVCAVSWDEYVAGFATPPAVEARTEGEDPVMAAWDAHERGECPTPCDFCGPHPAHPASLTAHNLRQRYTNAESDEEVAEVASKAIHALHCAEVALLAASRPSADVREAPPPDHDGFTEVRRLGFPAMRDKARRAAGKSGDAGDRVDTITAALASHPTEGGAP